MKTYNKMNFLATLAIVAVLFSSCTVEYRNRHPRRVRVYGAVQPINQERPLVAVSPESDKSNPYYVINSLSFPTTR